MTDKLSTNGKATVNDQLEHKLHKRMRFIEGQARGVQRMLTEGRDLADVFTQLLAIQSGARAATELIVRDRMMRYVSESINQVIYDCIGECEVCDHLEVLRQTITEMDYSSMFDELMKLR